MNPGVSNARKLIPPPITGGAGKLGVIRAPSLAKQGAQRGLPLAGAAVLQEMALLEVPHGGRRYRETCPGSSPPH